MATSQDANEIFAYRCESCGKLDVRRVPRKDTTCPECGKQTLAPVALEGGALRYTVADRERGPSIEDGRLGRMAYFAGWMELPQIAACLKRQKEAAKGGGSAPKFGEVAVQERLMSGPQVGALLRVQVIHNGPGTQDLSFGAVAVREKFITQAQLDECLQLQKNLLHRHLEAPRIGILLAEKKYLKSDQVKKILQIQARHGQGPLVKLQPKPKPKAKPEAAVAAALAEAAPPVEDAEVPAEELTKDRVLCRCKACGKSELRPAWTAEDTCPVCGSSKFEPVPIVGDKADPTLTQAGPGPAIQDGRVGRMALFAGWMTRKQVQTCLRLQEQAGSRGEDRLRFGELAVREGYLTEPDLAALLRIQKIQRPAKEEQAFGVLAVRAGLISQDQLDDCLAEQQRLLKEHNQTPTLGLLLCDKELLTERQVKAILDFQARAGTGLLAELEALRAAAAPGGFKNFLAAAKANSALAAAVCVVVVLFSGVVLGTGWFGAVGWEPPEVVAACRHCGAVLEVSGGASTGCPACQKARALAPMVRCKKCGHIFAFGPYGVGTHCTECDAAEVEPVKSLAKAKAGWKPITDEPEGEDAFDDELDVDE